MPDTAQDAVGDARWGEVARAAAQAFDLLPADLENPRPEDRGPVRPRARTAARRLETDPDTVERDLLKLVLTIVELLRTLMERTALHRVDKGDLTDEQEERIGMTLMVLHDRMTDLCARYDITLDDLNLDLGPLGSLLPPGGAETGDPAR